VFAIEGMAGIDVEHGASLYPGIITRRRYKFGTILVAGF